MSIFKVCPKCGGIASYNSHFQSFVCECGWMGEGNDMDYKELAFRLINSVWKNPGMTDAQSLEWDAADAITDLLARTEAAEADNKKLISAMMHLKRTENFERMSVTYELEYDSSLSHKTMEEVAGILFRGLMDADLKQC